MALYPPLINPSVPAFLLASEDTIDSLTVYFSHNRAVDPDDVRAISLLMWVQGDKDKKIKTFRTADFNCEQGIAIFTNSDAVDETEIIQLQKGLYYKIQIAYISNDTDTAEHYSTVGVTKCIGTKDSILFDLQDYREFPLDLETIYPNFYNYEIKFKANDLPSERIYHYRFLLRDDEENIIEGGKWQFPDKNKKMYFSITEPLQDYIIYHLDVEIQTLNGLSLLKTYKIIKDLELPNLYKGGIMASQNEEALDNGYVYIELKPYADSPGSYRILRQCATEEKWYEIATFNTVGGADELARYKWKDFSVEHGQTYTYAIQQCSFNEPRIFSELIKADPITVSFEHIFLSDGERQLRIMFNPQVSSLKETILEQKTDTIGSKFPFFARNGHVRYKEIPLSGLISYWMDSDQYFGISIEDLGLPLYEAGRQSTKLIPAYRTNLDDINFRAERQFKLKVLEWLNNGKPKLFRSPAEGNYVLRLMNTNLAPNAQVGRLLHTFNATGYEVANATMEELGKNNVLLVQQMFPSDDYLEGIDDYFRTIKSYRVCNFEVTKDNPLIFSKQGCKLVRYISIFYKGSGGVIGFYDEEDNEYALDVGKITDYVEFKNLEDLNNIYTSSVEIPWGNDIKVIVNAWVEMLPEKVDEE